MFKICLINCRHRISYSQVAGPYCGKPVQWPVSSSTEQAVDILKSWVALMRNRWPVLNWKLRFVILSPYFRESNILVSLMEEHGIGGGLGGKRNIQDPNLNPRWLLHVILTPFLFLVCILQCGEIQGETGQTRKVPWRRRGLVKNDLNKGNLHPWWRYTWFLVLGHQSILLSGIPTALTSLAILFTGWGKGLEVCRYYWFWWW